MGRTRAASVALRSGHTPLRGSAYHADSRSAVSTFVIGSSVPLTLSEFLGAETANQDMAFVQAKKLSLCLTGSI